MSTWTETCEMKCLHIGQQNRPSSYEPGLLQSTCRSTYRKAATIGRTVSSWSLAKSKRHSAILQDNHGLLCDSKGHVSVHSEVEQLELRILMAAHSGIEGYRREIATMQAMSEEFVWKGIDKDANHLAGHSFISSRCSQGS